MKTMFLDKNLNETVGMKSQNLHLMRFIAAIMVIISHAYPIATGEELGEWFTVLTGNQLTMGGFAVSLFFLCGGYLIAMSVEKNKTAKRYFTARVKRLIPPLFFVVVLTMFFGMFFSTYGPVGYILSVDTWKYLLNSILISVKTLPGVFVTNPFGATINGSLWTLPVEFICYILCFIAYKLKFMEKKRFPFSVPLVILGTIAVWFLGLRVPLLREVIRPVVLFYIGIAFWVYREHISLNKKYFAISSALCVLMFALGIGRAAMYLCFPYMMMYIWFGMKQCSEKLGYLGNYSYGIYLWGFPVQQMIMFYNNGEKMNPLLNMSIAIPITIVLGAFTFELVENNLKGIPEKVKQLKCPHIVFIAIMFWYSMRHVNWGLDLCDTGYSYSNFQYMSYDHMDPMWIFSTYLANVVGHFISLLPFADSLLGMNFYTTLLVVGLAITGYFFGVKKLGMPRWIAFAGGCLTLALSWCPSSVLYNYVTYILVVACVILLYKGLTARKDWWLFAAGICLGANVLTRFSNLPQAALILGVWLYGFIESKESKNPGALKETVHRTLWCLGGYLTGLGVFLGYIHFRYGITEYINGILRLLSMTDQAEGYKSSSMVSMVIEQFVAEIPFVFEMIKYIVAGMAVWAVIELAKKYIKPISQREWIKTCMNAVGFASSVFLGVKIIERLYVTGFCVMNYYVYDSILGPAVVFMILTILVAIVNALRKDVSKEEKLIGILIALLLIVNSLGSSNGLFSSFNNLCLAAPYTFYNCYKFVRNIKNNFAWPAKCVLIGYIFVLVWQSYFFSQYFFFVDTRGGDKIEYYVENNEVLEGIKMHPDRVAWLTSITDYVKQNDLEGREVILYGNIPSLSYYLQMPPAFNSWPDLLSYNIKQLSLDLEKLQNQMDTGEVAPPIVITDAALLYNEPDDKWLMIQAFMEENGYESTFFNGKFMLYEKTAQ